MTAFPGLATSPRLHHVGIVQPDLEAADAYIALFDQEEAYRGYVEPFECWCIFLKAPEGNAQVELVVPTGGPLEKFNKGAGGLHHYAFETPDLAATMAAMTAKGAGWLRPDPVKGAGDFICNFLSPIATRGVIVEYIQPLATS